MGFGIKKEAGSNTTPSQLVNFDKLTPTTAGVVFTPNIPATLDVLYVSSVDASTWIWNGTGYITYSPPATATTEWYLLGTTIDAGSNKTAPISRDNSIYTQGYDSYFNGVRIGRGASSIATNTVVGNGAGNSISTGFSNTFNGYQSGQNVSTGTSNSFFGYFSGRSNTTAQSNTFIGDYSGYSNTVGQYNTFVGGDSGLSNTNANYNTFIGAGSGFLNTTAQWNTFLGHFSGHFNTTGQKNTFLGSSSGQENTIGEQNTFSGYYSGYFNTTGSYNTFSGVNSGFSNTTGSGNTFSGQDSGHNNISGGGNTFFGNASGFSNNTASNNSAFGTQSLFSNTTGTFNTISGYNSGYYNTTGGSNSFFGASSGFSNTTGNYNTFSGVNSGFNNTTASYNTFIGNNSGYNNTSGGGNLFFGNASGFSNTTASNNSAFGTQSLFSNTTGTFNTISGYNSGYYNTTGSYNTFSGVNSGYSNTTGAENSFFGMASGNANTTANYNTFSGAYSGFLNTTGFANSFFGKSSGGENTTGSRNTFLGESSGTKNTTGNDNTFIGQNSGKFIADGTTALTDINTSVFLGGETKALADSQTNQIVIGYNAIGKGSNTVNIGNTSITNTYLNGAVTFNNAFTFPTTDGTATQSLVTNGAGVVSWVDGGSAIPQANTIYVDSVNGVNATTGRGDINKPYLTPEYALGNITNTGTVTATTTSTSATLTAVSDTTNIKVGQYITGTGIPYESIVVSKTSNTIVLSKACTASATITATWWTVYEVILSGNFVVTSNIHKIGFYINSSSLSATISYGNLTLFTFTSNILIPIYISLGKTFGTHANSCLIYGNGFSAIDGFLNLGNYYSLYTSFNLGGIGTSALTFTNLTINTEMFDCRFGSISYISVSGNFTWNGNAYGLLGGLRYSGANTDVNGKITTPSSVNAIYGVATRGNINGAILGSYTHTGGINLYANVVGTTALIDSGDAVKSVNVYGTLSMTTINLGLSPNILNGDITGNVNVSGLSQILGNVVNGTINGTVTVNSGSIKFNGNQEGNYSSRYMTVVIGNGNFINSGSIRLVSLTYTGTGKFTNDGAIFTNGATNTSAPIRITNGGKFINNKDITQNPETDICPLVEKTDGVFVNNGRMYSPFNMYVKYAANTSASKEVILAYAMSNGNILANSTTGTGIINRFAVINANTDTSVTIFDGTNTVVISVVGAGKTVAVISAEIVAQIKASILLFQNCSYPVIGLIVFVGRTGFTPTFTATTNIGTLGTYVGGGGFAGTVIGGGTELLSSSFNY